MTKKSAARQLKDEIKKNQKHELVNNRCWDDLHSMYATMGQLFVQYSHLGIVMQNEELMSCVADRKSLTSRVLIITHDLKELKNELLAIHATHKDRTGGPRGDDVDAQALDLMNSVEIGQHYDMWLQKHNGVVLPTFNEINAALVTAEAALKNVMAAVRTDEQEIDAQRLAVAAMKGQQAAPKAEVGTPETLVV